MNRRVAHNTNLFNWNAPPFFSLFPSLEFPLLLKMRNSTFVYKNSWGKSHVLERINRGNCEDRFDPPQVRGRGQKNAKSSAI